MYRNLHFGTAAGLAGLAGLAGCDAATQPAELEQTSVPAVSASAKDPAERTIIERFDDEFLVDDPCFGETVLVQARRQLVVFERLDAAGGLHFKFKVIDQGSTVLGLTSGTVYRLNGADIAGVNVREGGFPAEATFLFTQTLTSPGAAPHDPAPNTAHNLKFRFLFHITVNANGTVTTEKLRDEVICR